MFDSQYLSVLFGISGTFILLFSAIFSHKRDINKKEKFSLISQIIGYLFLFNSFLYLLHDKISFMLTSQPAITQFSYWPYYLFISIGIIISLFLVKEKDYGWGLEVNFSIDTTPQTILFYSPALLGLFALILNNDLLPIINIILWFWLMSFIWKKKL